MHRPATNRLRERWNELGDLPRALAGVAVLALVAGALAAALLVAIGDRDVEPGAIAEAGAGAKGDPFAYTDAKRVDFEDRAAYGLAHVLYEKSPGGVIASARRTAAWRDEIGRAAARAGADPDLMEAIVFLESAGRPQVIAGDDPEAASGLTQIVAETGRNLLGMRVELGRSRQLTKGMARAERRAAELAAKRDRVAGRKFRRVERRIRRLQRRQRALRRKRAAIDERFDPRSALEGMGRYLEIADGRFGREDLAVQSYHMGIGNLEEAIRRYANSDAEVRTLVDEGEIGYARLYFDSSPLRNDRAWKLISSLGDESFNYFWKVLASRQIMRLYRRDRDELERLIALQDAKATAEQVFHPEGETEVFADPGELEDALNDGELAEIPGRGRRFGYEIGDQLGNLASENGAEPRLYRSLRPEALAGLIYLTSRVRAINGGRGSLTVTSAVRDRAYQDLLVGGNVEATPNYSLHTTGWSFDILRRYHSKEQAEAFQFVLDRLRALAVIDYAVEPSAIHITVSDRAEPLLDAD